MHYSDKVSKIIVSGSWYFPSPNSRHHHLAPVLDHWLKNFDNPVLSPGEDTLSWDGLDATKVKTWHVWNSIRNRNALVPWSMAIWHKLRISRYAHHQWLVCHGKLSTLSRLYRFGIVQTQQCFLCIGGKETDNHLFLHCHYSRWILSRLLGSLSITIIGDSWLDFLQSLLHLQDCSKKLISLCYAQVFCYNIWRECNARAHNGGVFGPSKLQQGITKDIIARLQGSPWFSNLANTRPDLYSNSCSISFLWLLMLSILNLV